MQGKKEGTADGILVSAAGKADIKVQKPSAKHSVVVIHARAGHVPGNNTSTNKVGTVCEVHLVLHLEHLLRALLCLSGLQLNICTQ